MKVCTGIFDAKLTVEHWRLKLKLPKLCIWMDACFALEKGSYKQADVVYLLEPEVSWRQQSLLFCRGKICNSIFVLIKKGILWSGLPGTWIFNIRTPGCNCKRVWDGLWSTDALTNVWFNVEKHQHNDPFTDLFKTLLFPVFQQPLLETWT